MDIQGKIIFAAEPRTGTSARTGQQWKSQDFVIETHDTYPRKCMFSVFGEDKLQQFNIKIGDELTVSFDIDAHEYQGRWFNSIRAWKVLHTTDIPAAPAGAEVAPMGAPAVPAADPLGSPIADEGSINDLPF